MFLVFNGDGDMKKIILSLIPAIAVMGFAASCNKNIEAPVAPVDGEQVTIHASVQPAASKIDLTPNEAGMHLAWEDGDCLRVISGSQSQVFDIQDGFSDHEAEFVGSGVSGSSFDILYPGTFETLDEAKAYYNETFTQNGNGNTAHLDYIACLCGVDSYTDIAFTEAWASAHGGSFLRPAIIRLCVHLPDGVSKLSKVRLTFGEGDEYDYVLNLKNVDVSTNYQDLTAYLVLPYYGFDLIIAAGQPSRLEVSASDGFVYVKNGMTWTNVTFKTGTVSTIRCTEGVHLNLFAGGSGTESDPYLIADKTQLQNMHADGVLVAGEKKYFELSSDIDLDGDTWVPLNYDNGFNKGIHFDGKGHTISNFKATNATNYPSFVGVLNGTLKNVVFDGIQIEAGSYKSGVAAGYAGTGAISGELTGITVKNCSLTGTTYMGGLVAQVANLSAPISNCHVINTSVTSTGTGQRVGGLVGQLGAGYSISGCSAENVAVSAYINVGGLVGCCYGNVTDCTSSGTVTSSNEESNKDIAIGGLAGYFETGTISRCSSSATVTQSTNGRDIGGLVGKMLIATLEKSYATGAVTGQQRNVGGLVGLVTNNGTGTSLISDCYASGKVTANAYSGGLIGLYEKGLASIVNCYASGDVLATGGFAIGGLIGVAAAADITMSKSAAWKGAITPKSFGSANWSSAACVGVTFPTCTMTDNYRSPDMKLLAYWGTEEGYTYLLASDYNHQNVSAEHPLVKQDGTETTATGTGKGQDGYPQFPYHGKVEAGKTLSELASTTLGWDSTVWDFSGSMPALK